MLRTIAIAVVVAVTLAGGMLLPSSAHADQPATLICVVDTHEKNTPSTGFFLDIEFYGGMQKTVAYCLSLGGHPAGLRNRKMMEEK